MFARYKAGPVYQGKLHFPDFRGRDRAWKEYRTDIRDEIAGGVNFAGHYRVIQIGCGTGCSTVYVADVKTGHMLPNPPLGLDTHALDMRTKPDSRLILALWEEYPDRCFSGKVVWTGTSWRMFDRKEHGTLMKCWFQGGHNSPDMLLAPNPN